MNREKANNFHSNILEHAHVFNKIRMFTAHYYCALCLISLLCKA